MLYYKSLLWASAFTLLVTACKKDDNTVTPVKPALSIADVSQAEGNADGVLTFKATLSQAATTNVLVSYATLDGTAVAGPDYIAKTDGNLTFAPGETEKDIVIQIKGDDVSEPDEQFSVLLLNPVNATLSRDRAKGTILNDDSSNPLIIPTSGYSTPLTYPGKTLVWQDEFDGATLNSNFWTHETGTGQSGWGNNELQYYRPENTTLVSGNLVIEARQEAFGGAAYTSSRLVTKDKKTFKYGRIDIRAALPEGQGMWPALWMLGANLPTAGWPSCGELDMMEIIGSQPGRVYGTVHYASATGDHLQIGNSKALAGGAKFSEAFHVFSVVWEQDRIRWYLDDVLYHEVTPTILGTNNPYPFNQDFFFIFNLAVGGNWPGSPDAATVFPQRLIVDYIRVFQ